MLNGRAIKEKNPRIDVSGFRFRGKKVTTPKKFKKFKTDQDASGQLVPDVIVKKTEKRMTREADQLKPHGRRPCLIIAFKVLISVMLLSLIVAKIDFSKMIETISAVDAFYPFIAVIVLVAQTVIVTWRWSSISRFFDLRIPFFPALKISYIGLLTNQVLPSFIAGDALRIYWLRKQGNALDAAFRVTIIDRVTATLVLVLMLLVCMPYLLSFSNSPPLSMGLWTIALGGTFSLIIIFLFDRLPTGLYRFKPIRELAAISRDVRKLSAWHRLSFVVALQALFGHLLTAIYIYLLAIGMGLQISLLQCLALMPPVILISMLPFSIAGWGVREGLMITGMVLFQIQPEAAFAVSILFGIVSLLHSLLGLPALLFSGMRTNA